MRLCLFSALLLLCACQTKAPNEDMIDELNQTIKKVRGVSEVNEFTFELTGNTPLIKAVIKNDLDEIKRLLKKNSDIYQLNEQGLNALELAAFIGDYETVLYLIANATDLEDNLNQDLIYLSTWNGDNRRLIIMLFTRLKMHYYQNSFHLEKVLKVLTPDMIDFILVNLEPDVLDDKNFSPFTYVNDKKTINRLIENGYSLNSSPTALLSFSYRGKLDILKEYWDYFPSVDSFDIYGNTALSYSVEEENLEIVKFLISKGANPYLPDNEGISSFHKAKMKPEILKVLKQSEHTSAPPKHRFAIKEKYKKYLESHSERGRKDAEKHFKLGYVYEFHGMEGGIVPAKYVEDKGIFIFPWYLSSIYTEEEIVYRKAYSNKREALMSSNHKSTK